LNSGLDNCIVLDYEKGDSNNYEFKVFSKPNSQSNILWSFISAQKVASMLRANNGKTVVRSKQNLGAWTAYLTAKLLGSKFVLRMGYSYAQSKRYENFLGLMLYPVFYLYELSMVHLADRVIVSSEYLAKKFFITNYSLIRNSINLRFTRERKLEKIYHWISVGRIIKMKGSESLEQFSSLRHDGLIIGENTDNIDLGKNTFYPKLNNQDIPNYFGSSKYYVSFSLTEGNPKTLMEAIFAGCIPVLSNIQAHTDVIDELGYGFIINNIQDAHHILNQEESNFSETEYLRFVDRWSLKSVVKMELKLLYECVE
jgi:glycosyltransferase involved in cell wall biosynthesis